MTTLYRDKEGQRLPSAATIIGRLKDAGGLIRWAHHRLDFDDTCEPVDAGMLAVGKALAKTRDRDALSRRREELVQPHLDGGIIKLADEVSLVDLYRTRQERVAA